MEIEWRDLWAAVALLLVLEGMMPFLSPSGWRRMVILMSEQSNSGLRVMGFVSMLMGALILYFTR